MTGNRKYLLEYLATNKNVGLSGVLNEVYDDKKAAKDALRDFEEAGWIELKGFGSFEITDKGYKRYQSMKTLGSSGSSERRLDTF